MFNKFVLIQNRIFHGTVCAETDLDLDSGCTLSVPLVKKPYIVLHENEFWRSTIHYILERLVLEDNTDYYFCRKS